MHVFLQKWPVFALQEHGHSKGFWHSKCPQHTCFGTSPVARNSLGPSVLVGVHQSLQPTLVAQMSARACHAVVVKLPALGILFSSWYATPGSCAKKYGTNAAGIASNLQQFLQSYAHLPIVVAGDFNLSRKKLEALVVPLGFRVISPRMPTTFKSNGLGRPDHIVCSKHILSGLVEVESGASDPICSDHAPLECAYQLPAGATVLPSVSMSLPLKADGDCRQERWCMHWEASKQGMYVAGLDDLLHLNCTQLNVAEAEGNATVFHDVLVGSVMQAAASAGMLHCSYSHVAASQQRHPRRPFWSKQWRQHCRPLRQKVRQLVRERSDYAQIYAARRAYMKECRRQQRRAAAAAVKSLGSQFRAAQHGWWAQFRKGSRVSQELHFASKQSWQEAVQHTFGAQAPLQYREQVSVSMPPNTQYDPSTMAGGLDSPCSLQEVLYTLSHLKEGKAAGPDALRPEAFKHAVHPGDPSTSNILAIQLVRLFNVMLRTGSAPAYFAQLRWSPVYKKAHDNLCKAHRMLAVTNAVYRVWARLLHSRLQEWQVKWIHPCQYGFRKGAKVALPLFVLSTIIRSALKVKWPLHLAYIDIEGAYDNVYRQHLWCVLERLGVPALLMSLLQSMYSSCWGYVDTPTGKTDPISVPKGLMQGCPLSPLLFNACLMPLFQVLTTVALHDQQRVPFLHSLGISALAWADDILLIAASPVDLQRLLDTTGIWLESVGLRISDTKCKIMSISPWLSEPFSHASQFTCQGVPIKISTSEVYLGVLFESLSPFGSMFGDKMCKATAAYHACFDDEWRCVLKHLPKMYMTLYESKVMSVLLNACEIWASGIAWKHLIHNPVEKFRCKALIPHSGLPRCTPHLAFLWEIGITPVVFDIAQRMVHTWSDLLHCHTASPEHQAVCQEIAWLRAGEKSCWTASFQQLLQLCTPQSQHPYIKSRLHKGFVLDKSWLQDQMKQLWSQQLRPFQLHDPRDPGCPHRQLAMYAQFMACSIPPRSHYWFSSLPLQLRKVILSWRLGATQALAVHMHSLPFPVRICLQCSGGGHTCIQDAFHVLCECPVTQLVIPDALLPIPTRAAHTPWYSSLRQWWAVHLRSQLGTLATFLQDLQERFSLDRGE